MKKRIILLLIILSVLLLLAYLSFIYSGQIKRQYVRYVTDISDGTGAIQMTPNPQVEAEGKAINSLQKNLPISTATFTINSYDYSGGKFEVQFKSGIINETELSIWLKNSPYKDISTNMFYFK